MSGFSAEWLALREPADLQARNPGIARMLQQAFAEMDRIAVCDLGAGTGSSVRALAPLLPRVQDWTLIDHDPALLTAARAQLSAWAAPAQARQADDRLSLEREDQQLSISLQQADLRRDLDQLLPASADLINGSALIDLVSDAWLDQLTLAAAKRAATVLMSLNYAGVERWQPAHESDDEIQAAFNAHQQGNKAFGPALGPRATEVLARKLKNAGYEVVLGPSPWRLSASRDAALMAMLAEGIAGATAETGQIAPKRANAWLHARRAASTAEIGHIDLFARLP